VRRVPYLRMECIRGLRISWFAHLAWLIHNRQYWRKAEPKVIPELVPKYGDGSAVTGQLSGKWLGRADAQLLEESHLIFVGSALSFSQPRTTQPIEVCYKVYFVAGRLPRGGGLFRS
jgi:hypothetical protein